MDKEYTHPTPLAEASDPATFPSRLEELSRHEDPAVRQAVIVNPNTPLPGLFFLAKEFPDHFFTNPVLPLLYLAHPGLEQQIDEESWLHLLRSRLMPTHWLAWLRKSRQTDTVSITATLHTNSAHIPRKIDASMTNALSQSIGIIAQQERTPVKILESLASAFSSDYFVKMHIAHNPATPRALLTHFFFTNMKSAVVRNPHLPRELLEQVSSASDEWDVRNGAAANPITSHEMLTRLALDPHGTVRRSVAHNPATPAEVLMSLAHDKDNLIRAEVALNRNTPSDILTQLGKDPSTSVREYVALNRNTPSDVLTQLGKDPSRLVREYVVSNLSAPVEIRVQLAKDLRQPTPDSQDQMRLAARGQLAWLERLEKRGVREPDLSRYAQRMFEAEKTIEKCKGLTSYDESWSVIHTLCDPALPDELRQALIDPFLSFWKDRWRERAHYHNQQWSGRLLPRLYLTWPWQKIFATSPLWTERYIMAIKAGVASSLLEKLVQDGNCYVSAAARFYLEEKETMRGTQDDNAL